MKKTEYTPMIEPMEAVKLAWEGLSIAEADHAKQIVDAWKEHDPVGGKLPPMTFELYRLCANLFEAGRLQGVREERQRKAAAGAA